MNSTGPTSASLFFFGSHLLLLQAEGMHPSGRSRSSYGESFPSPCQESARLEVRGPSRHLRTPIIYKESEVLGYLSNR